MGTLHTITAPPPSLYVTGDRPPVANAYFAITIDAAVDLLEAREYRDLPRTERLSRAHAEQQGFLNWFLDPALGAALDLRLAVDPAASTPVSAALLGRVWGDGTPNLTARAEELRSRVHAALPRHVIATPVADGETVAGLLAPFPAGAVDSAVITRREFIGTPSRPDAGVAYYYSATPFHWSDNDWSSVYSALAASPVPLVVSIAVLPMLIPSPFGQMLLNLATFYGRLAWEDQQDGGPYYGRQRLAPDAFAVDASATFQDFSRRLSRKAFALRIQVSAAKQLPPGIVETVAGAISPAERADRLVEQQRAPAYEVRRPASVAERRLAEYNLNVINFGMLSGRPEIWGRPDPPDSQLALLSVLGDARDAGCAFRFPIAVDGTAGGFPVRRGQLGQADVAQAGQATGTVIRLGTVSGTGRAISIPLRSLTRHALIAGSTGSGTATTALGILRQLWAEHGIPFLVIEPANSDADDYRKLAGEPGFETLEIITVGDEEGAPLRFNPFEVPAGVGVGEHAANLLACFSAAFGLFGPLPSIYRDALNLTYLRAGFLFTERAGDLQRTWPTVVEFLAAIAEVTEGLGYTGDVKANIDAASVGPARQLVRGVTGSAFLTDRPRDIGRLLDHPVILELRSLGSGDELALMMALLLNAVTEHCRSARGPSPDLVHVTLVEDAHRVLARAQGDGPTRGARARESAAGALASRLADNGRYGEGMIIAERLPARLVADAVKNAGLRIVHRLAVEDGRRHLGQAMGLDEAQRLSADRLRTGEALLYRDELAEAALVSVEGIPLAAAPRPGVVMPSAVPPFAACAPCRAQCAYRGAALSMLNDPGIVKDITDAAGPLAQAGGAPAEQGAALAELRGRLYDTLGRFAALPAADPGRSDAAFCLLLHVYASSATRDQSAGPAIVARFLQDPATTEQPPHDRPDR
ncbi:MAG: ATP-binding protein [Trebonia sp.]